MPTDAKAMIAEAKRRHESFKTCDSYGHENYPVMFAVCLAHDLAVELGKCIKRKDPVAVYAVNEGLRQRVAEPEGKRKPEQQLSCGCYGLCDPYSHEADLP